MYNSVNYSPVNILKTIELLDFKCVFYCMWYLDKAFFPEETVSDR